MSRKLDARMAEIVVKLPLKDIYDTDGEPLMQMDFGVKSYSTDHNAAFEVVDKLEGFHFNLQRLGDNWYAEFAEIVTKGKLLHEPWVGEEGSRTTAICLAALRAKGDGEWVDNYLKEANDA